MIAYDFFSPVISSNSVQRKNGLQKNTLTQTDRAAHESSISQLLRAWLCKLCFLLLHAT